MEEKTMISDRLCYLAEKFNVIDISDKSDFKKSDFNDATLFVRTPNNRILSVITSKPIGRSQEKKKISISSDVFSDMIGADPTENKMYLQWMLHIFVNLINKPNDGYQSAIRFVEEDLPQANAYLELFEGNKRKKLFAELCKANYSLIHVKDPTDINQYKTLSQLFDAVDPFIKRDTSTLEKILNKFVDLGQAEIPVKDRKFTLYIPKSTAASVVFANFSSWCTAREGNSMFTSYTSNNKTPNGENSKIYIVIDNGFFKDENKDLYQIHFETNQFKDYKNSETIGIYENIIEKSDGIANYFYNELMGMAKENKKGIDNNVYLDYLIKFGFTESLFDMLDVGQSKLRIMGREIPKLPDISRFKNLDQIIITDASLSELHPSIGSLGKLQLLSLTNNKIKVIPKEIGSLKKLEFLNIVGNPINEIPDEIKYLDISNGGSLSMIAVSSDDIGENNLKKIKKLLPNVVINNKK